MRRVLWIVGVGILLLAWLGPSTTVRASFYAHMSVHMAVVAVAAPLLALALSGEEGAAARIALPLGAAAHAPLLASLVEFVVVWVWHAPLLHHAARQHALFRAAEQGTFLLSGLFLWLSAFGWPGGAQRTESRAAGVVALLLTSMHMTLLGALLALAPRALYPHCGGSDSLTPLQDQHLGGIIMILVGGASYLAGGLCLLADLLLRPRQPLVQT